MKRYRVHTSGFIMELDAKSKLEVAMKVIKESVNQDHIRDMLERYGRFQVAVDEVKDK